MELVAALQADLDELVQNSAQTGTEYRWFAYESELFPIGGGIGVANQEWLSFARVVRGGTNCVGQTLLLAELAHPLVDTNDALGRDGHWMNQVGVDGTEFSVDAWSDAPPFAEGGGPGLLSWDDVLELWETSGPRPMADNLFRPSTAEAELPICTSPDWLYDGTASVEELLALPHHVPADERERALIQFLTARVHHVYGDAEGAWLAYSEFLSTSCSTMNPQNPDRTVKTFCRSSITHMRTLRPEAVPCDTCWWAQP
ncbi:MAG: hypothetical protein ACJAYU_000687 [Bradymonadia bacterium]